MARSTRFDRTVPGTGIASPSCRTWLHFMAAALPWARAGASGSLFDCREQTNHQTKFLAIPKGSKSLSFAQKQRAAQDRGVARKFDVHRLPWSQVPERIRQGPQIWCLDAAENQKPVARFEPGVFGSGSAAARLPRVRLALKVMSGTIPVAARRGCPRCRRPRDCAAGALPVKFSGSARAAR